MAEIEKDDEERIADILEKVKPNGKTKFDITSTKTEKLRIIPSKLITFN